ncbi:hypothetical protein JCM3765_005320 [Sporobolomyces pararoseus]
MLNTIRGIVSGKKARYQEEGFDLDLVRITDRMIIMGYPAAGLASLYRNKRSDVLRFLEPYAPHYRIFNLCPLYENSYDANEIVHEGVKRQEGNSAVERYPWPDHHPPPLSLFRIMVQGAKKWYEADPRNVIVIHCKAGKGRSGTFAISILMALPGLPSSPTSSSSSRSIEGSGSKTEEGTGDAEDSTDPVTTRDLPSFSAEEVEQMGMNEKLDWLLKFHTQRRMKPNVKNLGVSISSQRRFLRYWARLLEGDDPRSALSNFEPKRLVVLEYVRVIGDGLKGPQGRMFGVGNDKIAVQVWRYKDSVAQNLRKRELDILNNGPNPKGDEVEGETDWDDRDKMFIKVGGFVESTLPAPSSASSVPPSTTTTGNRIDPSSSSSRSTLELPRDENDENALEEYASTSSTVSPYPPSSPSSSPSRKSPASTVSPSSSGKEKLLIPHTSFVSPSSTNSTARSDSEAKKQISLDGGIVVDGEREMMLKFLVGETGKKHGKLPTMAALAITWFIPLFEQPGKSGDQVKMKLGAKDLDFVKSFAGIDEVEIGWRWV